MLFYLMLKINTNNFCKYKKVINFVHDMTTKELLQIATKVADDFGKQSDDFSKAGDLKNANELLNREIGARTVITQIYKVLTL